MTLEDINKMLSNIEDTVTPMLGDCTIQDIVFRPFSVGVNAPGYSLVLANWVKTKVRGHCFGLQEPTVAEIKNVVGKILDDLRSSH
jgi:hypothetical protein